MRNSRDILFRAWDGERMVRVFGLFPERKSITTNRHCRTDIHGDFEITVKHLISDISLMQYTGLKDKNGKDIYEGDVVAITDGQVWSVEFYDGGFQSFNQLNSFRRLEDSLSKMSYSREDNLLTPVAEFTIDGINTVLCEVIGNIHENPELLEND